MLEIFGGKVFLFEISIFMYTDSLPNKPQSMSSVYCWGGGFNTPNKLPLPTNDTQVVEVSAGRTQKAAVTKNGRLFNWEVKHQDII